MFFNTDNFNGNAKALLNDYLEYTKNKRTAAVYSAQNNTIPQAQNPTPDSDKIESNTDGQMPQPPQQSPNEETAAEPQNPETDNNSTAPKWPLEEPSPRRISSGYNDTDFETDMELMRLLYSNINKWMYPVIIEVLNEYEYDGSPIFSDQIDKETIAQMTDRVLVRASERFDEAQEIILDSYDIENNDRSGLVWGRQPLLRAIAESLLLNDIFGIRRPRFRKMRNNYRYSHGRYGGLNYYY